MKRIFYEILEHLSFALIRFICKIKRKDDQEDQFQSDHQVEDDASIHSYKKEDDNYDS